MFDEHINQPHLGEDSDEEVGSAAGTPPPDPRWPVAGANHAADLAFLVFVRDGLAALDMSGTAKEHHEKIALTEEIKGAASGAQVMSATMLEAEVITQRTEAGARMNNPAFGVGAQIALARRESPERGRSFLAFSRRLLANLQFTLAALVAGKISEAHARIIDRETEHLNQEHRQEVDRNLLKNPDAFKGLCQQAVTDRVRTLTYHYDSSDALTRLEEAKARRHAAVFPARDSMMKLTGMLPVEDGLAVRQALTEESMRLRNSGDPRTLSQLMADILVQRVTGKNPCQGVGIMLYLVMSDRTLFQGGSDPAHLLGYGTVPSTWARIMVGGTEPADRTRYRALVSLKRLYTHPDTGALTAMDSRSREFPKSLKDMINVRDQYCRTPYCNAPVKEFDHVMQYSRGGPTNINNGAARCSACNQTKEQTGWEEHVEDTGDRHTLVITTPTGHTYRSTAPPLPGTPI